MSSRSLAGLEFIAGLSVVGLLTSCGSSLSSGGIGTTIQGNAILGPVSGATVVAYPVTTAGAPDLSRPLANTTTDASGNYSFSVSMNSSTEPVIVQLTGGHYVEEATGLTVNLAQKTYNTLVPSISTGVTANAALGPLPDMAFKVFQHSVQAGTTNGKTLAQVAANANYEISQSFGLSDVVGTLPANPYGTIPNDATGRYALVMAALSKQAATAGVDSGTLVSALTKNLVNNGNLVAPLQVSVTDGSGQTVMVTPPTMAALSGTVTQVVNGTAGLVGVTPPPSISTPTFNATPPTSLPVDYVPGGPAPTATPTPNSNASPTATPTPSPTPSAVTPVTQTWHTPVQLANTSADFANLYYSSAGTGYVTYSVRSGIYSPTAPYDLYSVSLQSNGTFGVPVNVDMGSYNSNTGGGVLGSMFFASATNIWLSAESVSHLNVYQSLDGGATWAQRKAFAASDLDPAYNHSLWIDRGSGNADLFFGFETYNSVIGSSPLTQFYTLASGVLSATATALGKGRDPMSLIDTGSTIIISETGALATSTNGGSSFTQNNNVSAKEFLQVGSTIYTSAYDGLFKSTDGGLNFTRVYSGSLSGRLMGNANVLVVVNGAEDHVLTYRASSDGGLTWTASAILADYTSSGYYISNVSVAKSPSGRVGLVYSVEQPTGQSAYGIGCTGKGSYFTEFY